VILSPDVRIACSSDLILVLDHYIMEVTGGLIGRCLFLRNLDERVALGLSGLSCLNTISGLESRSDEHIVTCVDGDSWLFNLLFLRLV